jgi:hypothetical protein
MRERGVPRSLLYNQQLQTKMKAKVIENFVDRSTKATHLIGEIVDFDKNRVASLEKLGFLTRVEDSAKVSSAATAASVEAAAESKAGKA